MSNINPEHYREWIQKIEYNPMVGEWTGYFFPNYIFKTQSYLRLMQQMQNAVCREVTALVGDTLTVSVDDIYGNEKKREYSDARSVISYILRHKFRMTQQQIADVMNFGDHTTALWNINKIKIDEVRQKLERVQKIDVLRFS